MVAWGGGVGNMKLRQRRRNWKRIKTILKYQRVKKILFHLGSLHVGTSGHVVGYGSRVLTVVVHAQVVGGVR